MIPVLPASDAPAITAPPCTYFIWNGYPCVMEREGDYARAVAFIHGEGWAQIDPAALWYAVPRNAERVSEARFAASLGDDFADAFAVIAEAEWHSLRRRATG